MDFQRLHDRFVTHLRQRVSCGELTERGIARMTGVSQPHIHNVLKGKRLLSPQTADEILRQLNMDILDLIAPQDLMSWHSRQ